MILLFLYFQAPLGPIGKKAPLGPIKKLAPLGTLDKPPLAPLGSLRSDSLEKTKLSEIGKQNSRDSDTSSPARPQTERPLGKLAIGGLGRSFLKTESQESLERRDDSEQNSIRSGGSQKGILKSQQQQDVLLRQAMIQRDEKRIMFDLGSNIEFASEVSHHPSALSLFLIILFSDGGGGGGQRCI